jgi:uncharacterized protein (TIGR03118 family)
MKTRWNRGEHRAASFRANRLRPTLEILEDRTLLSTGYVQTNLVSNIPGLARFTDSNLQNPWGISFSPTDVFWISDGRASTSTLYQGSGQPVTSGGQFVVQISSPPFDPAIGATPTGTDFNGGSGFVITEGNRSGPALFLFTTEEGTIAGWNPDVDATNAIVVVDNSAAAHLGHGAVYKGMTLAADSAGTFLYAANFAQGTVDVFDSSFRPIRRADAFIDAALPAGFAPFNVQAIGGKIYVTYAEQDPARYDNVPGPGSGVVDVFDANGDFLQRLATGGPLDSPWGLALAPADFGRFSGDLLVGNFGNGHINAFNPVSGAFLGALTDSTGAAIEIPGLWALKFGNGAGAGPVNSLYFTSNLGTDEHGLFGELRAVGSHQAQLRDAVYTTNDTGDSNDNYPLPPASAPSLRDQTGLPTLLAPFLLLKETPSAPTETSQARADKVGIDAPSQFNTVLIVLAPTAPTAPTSGHGVDFTSDATNLLAADLHPTAVEILLDLARRADSSEMSPVRSEPDSVRASGLTLASTRPNDTYVNSIAELLSSEDSANSVPNASHEIVELAQAGDATLDATEQGGVRKREPGILAGLLLGSMAYLVWKGATWPRDLELAAPGRRFPLKG